MPWYLHVLSASLKDLCVGSLVFRVLTLRDGVETLRDEACWEVIRS
jgi:hypothetical protein